MRSLLFAMLSLGSSVACQTQFVGDPHISVPACQTRCTQSGLQMTGIVYMGEYSSACICELPRAPSAGVSAPAGALGAAAGVVMQMRSRNAAQNAAQTTPVR